VKIMKKATLLIVMVVLAVLFTATVVYAEDWGNSFPATHFGFSGASEGCAGCHVTHTASAAKLLKSGTTQTGFCYTCHGDTMNSPYDVEAGLILESGPGGDDSTTNNSTAGKFGFYGGGVTSRHDVDTPTVASVALTTYEVPGNNFSGLASGFKCGSCHDVHAGDSPSNDRLLKSTVFTGQTAIGVVDFVYNGISLVVTGYGDDQTHSNAINDYCGLCHNRFNVGNQAAKTLVDGSKQTVNGVTYYRHPVGIAVVTNTAPNLKGYLGNQDDGASATNKNLVLCLTCHYAHGTTKAANTSYANWSRDPDAAGSTTGTGSALLRMDGRGVCYDCHGAATKNLENYPDANT
jgi:predicted CXXCH cytochrome family protein